jgi:hypothetical protein
MKTTIRGLACVLALTGLTGIGYAQCKSLSTLFTGGNYNSIGGQNFFDLNVTKASGVTIESLDVNVGPLTAVGTTFQVDVYTAPNTHVGNELNMGAWTLVASGQAVSQLSNTPTPVDISDFSLPMGKVGICITFTNANLAYTNGTGANQTYSNADLTLTAGTATNAPWTGTVFTPRVFNGTIYYDCFKTVPFCTAKIGLVCGVPSISASGASSVSSSSGFVIKAGPARDNRSGILLYNNAGVVAGLPFEGGTLCVNAMGLRRAGSTNSMGSCPPTPIGCNGAFAIDMNTFAKAMWAVPDCAGAPTALPPNNPAGFLQTMGATIDVQFWGRDSVATGSFLSSGLSYVQGP